MLIDRLGGPKAASFHISSAGVRAVVNAPIHPDTRAVLEGCGLAGPMADRFVARQLSATMVEQSDLVLGASVRHRSAAVERTPTALVTAFSLREFARLAAAVDQALLPADPVARARALVEHARGRRGVAPPVSPDADQVPDPMGSAPQAHRESAALIRDAVHTIVDIIAPPAAAATDVGPCRR